MSEFKHTHYFIAQKIQLLDEKDGKFLVRFEDGSQGWKDGPIAPMNLIEAFIMGKKQ